jgi:ligand-binding sensor domain-containing protein
MSRPGTWLSMLTLCALLQCPAVAQSPFFQHYYLLKKSDPVRVNKIFQDSKGYIWIATQAGLFRSDGTRNVLIDRTSSDVVTALAEDSTGRIWTGSRSGKLGIVGADLKATLFEPPEGSAAAEVSDIIFDRAGNLWFSTYNDGLYYFIRDRLYRLDDADGLPDIFVYDIEEDPDGNIWAGTDGGAVICKLNGRGVEVDVVDYSDGLPDNIVRKVRSDGGRMLLATQDAGIVFVDRTSHKVTPFINGAWTFGAVDDMVVDEAQVWAATSGSGLVVMDRASQVLSSYPSALQAPSALLKDVEGNIWSASNSALVRCFNNYVQYIDVGESGNVGALAADAGGGLWYASDEGLFHRQPDPRGSARTTRKLTGTVYEKRKIISLHVDAAGAVWCGFYGEGAIRLDPVTNQIVDISSKLRNGNVLSIKERGEEIWLATLNGTAVVRSYKGEWIVENIGKPEGLKADYIYQVMPDSRGRIWFATDREGVVMRDESGFHHFDEFGTKAVYGFMEDAQHEIWANVQLDGLYRFAGQGFRKQESDPNVNCVTGTRSGNRLIVHDLGIDIEMPKDSTVRRLADEVGFAERKANLNAISTGPDGRIYIGTDNGIVVFSEPADVRSSPRPVITGLKAFDVSKALDPGLELSHDENNVTISFLGFWYQNPAGLGFQYKLDGYDLDWIYTGDRNAVYSSLPPGDYTFRVRVSNSDDFSRAPDVSLGFVVHPPFWRTTWFYLSVTVVVLVLGYSYVKWRERRLREDKQVLEERVRERTQQIQQKNEEIQAQAREIKVINENLERRVHERTHELERKNKALEEYAFINAHNLRSPVASILGLVNLLSKTNLQPAEKEMIDHMKSSAERLDNVVRSITESIEKGAPYDFDEVDDDAID